MSLSAPLRFAAAVLAGAVLVALPAASLAADPLRVDVGDDGYDDGDRDGNEDATTTVITAGETVEWVWGEENQNQHTVTSRPSSDQEFDSDAECEDDRTGCREPGNTFRVRFDEPGTYRYFCKNHLIGMTGTIQVEPAEDPSEDQGSSEPSSEPETEEPSSEPEPEEDEEDQEPSSEPQEEPQQDDADEADEADDNDEDGDDQPPSTDDGTDDGAERPSRRQATGRGFGVRQQIPDRPSAPGPEVAPQTAPDPTYSPFPTAPSVPDDTETDDNMAVTVPARDGEGPSRGVVVGVAVASLLGSAGALGKLVLFGQPWA